MNKTVLFAACTFFTTTFSATLNAQDATSSNVPDSVRAMIEQSQGGRYEQMARMQVDMQYGEFLNTLDGGSRKRQRVEDTIVDVISERAEKSTLAVTGGVGPGELETISSYAYLRGQLAPLLSNNELQRLDAQQGAMAEQQLRRNYTEQMARVAPDLTEANREMLLDTLVRYMLYSDTETQAARLTAEQLVNQNLMSLRSAREELQSQFSGEQLQQVNAFLDVIRSNLFLSAAMDEGSAR
ncbi:MAG: hypothetical protein WD396_11950 [Pseudohongiellaceae bacterium]